MSLKPSVENPLLAALVEPTSPTSISWLPQSTGWQCVLILFIGYLLLVVYRLLKRYRANAYRRAALSELENIQGSSLVPQLIRRTALYAYPRSEVAGLVGAEWETWLDQKCPDSAFSTQFSGLLANLAYSPESVRSDQQVEELKAQVAHWLKHHEVDHD